MYWSYGRMVSVLMMVLWEISKMKKTENFLIPFLKGIVFLYNLSLNTHDSDDKLMIFSYCSQKMVGWCEGVVYLTSPGHPTDTGLQLGKAYYPYSWYGFRKNVFISSVSLLLFLFLFLPCPFHLYYLFSFLPFFWEMTQNDPQKLCR